MSLDEMRIRKGFPGGRPFSRTRASTARVVDRTAKAVHRLGRIRRALLRPRGARSSPGWPPRSRLGDQNGIARGRGHFGQLESGFHESEVGFLGHLHSRSLPRTTTTSNPCRSHNAASVSRRTHSIVAPPRTPARSSRAGMPAASALATVPSRSTVRTIRPSASTSFSVSVTGRAATAPRPPRASAITLSIDRPSPPLVSRHRARRRWSPRQAGPRDRRHRVSALSPADRDEQPIHVALEDPRRRIADVLPRQHAHHHRHVVAR